VSGALIEETNVDRIASIDLAMYQVPLKAAVSDAKVLTGRQKPLAHIGMLSTH